MARRKENRCIADTARGLRDRSACALTTGCERSPCRRCHACSLEANQGGLDRDDHRRVLTDRRRAMEVSPRCWTAQAGASDLPCQHVAARDQTCFDRTCGVGHHCGAQSGTRRKHRRRQNLPSLPSGMRAFRPPVGRRPQLLCAGPPLHCSRRGCLQARCTRARHRRWVRRRRWKRSSSLAFLRPFTESVSDQGPARGMCGLLVGSSVRWRTLRSQRQPLFAIAQTVSVALRTLGADCAHVHASRGR